MARLVDFMIVMALVMLIAVLTGTLGEPGPGAGNLDLGSLVILGGAVLAEATLLRWWGRTPGKAALGMSVASMDGGRLTWWRSGLRALLVWGPALVAMTGSVIREWQLVVCFALLAGLSGPAVLRSDHRGLHDMILASAVDRPSRTRPALMQLVGVDLAVLGVVGFLGSYGAYGFGEPTPTWYFDSASSIASYGTATHVSFPPGVTRGYIFSTPLAPGRHLACVVTSGGRAVPLDTSSSPPPFSESFLPDFANAVRDLQPIYGFRGSGVAESTVTCQSGATSGSYAAGAVDIPTRTLANALEGASAAIGASGLVLILLGRRSRRQPAHPGPPA